MLEQYLIVGSQRSWHALQAYAFPKFHFDLHLCRSNRPPHTAVRGPGEIQATVLAEHLIEHVAARLRMDPMAVREHNFITHDGGAPALLCGSWKHGPQECVLILMTGILHDCK